MPAIAAGATDEDFRAHTKRAVALAQQVLREADAENRSLTAEESRVVDRVIKEAELRGAMSTATPAQTEERWPDLATGKEIRVLTPGESFRSVVTSSDDSEGLSFGAVIRAMLTGPKSDLERRALSEGTDSAGGFTVPDVLGVQLIDRLRARATVFREERRR